MPATDRASASYGDGRRALRKGVRLAARLREKGTPFEIKVTDLSVTGFRAETIYNLPIGSRVFITLPGLAGIEAQVVWRNPSHAGCEFKTPLHPAVLDHIATLGR